MVCIIMGASTFLCLFRSSACLTEPVAVLDQLYHGGQGGASVFIGAQNKRIKQRKQGNISPLNKLSEPKSHLQLWSCRLQIPYLADENCDSISIWLKLKLQHFDF
ncbi:hypothetical protein ATANTOWER_026052 [Ataeniobius toweri]|uniref:Secreted protein n=1 Tax=Ataeniobius toweri TaxID=208326 RepID=A0ABU7A8F9_9TELE|nr:hypothetical protein [Ataeniobius toweri]